MSRFHILTNFDPEYRLRDRIRRKALFEDIGNVHFCETFDEAYGRILRRGARILVVQPTALNDANLKDMSVTYCNMQAFQDQFSFIKYDYVIVTRPDANRYILADSVINRRAESAQDTTFIVDQRYLTSSDSIPVDFLDDGLEQTRNVIVLQPMRTRNHEVRSDAMYLHVHPDTAKKIHLPGIEESVAQAILDDL